MIEAMDTEIGRLLKSVDLATTSVIFMGDNGTPNEVTAAPYSPDHAKLRVYEQGVRVPMIVAGSGLKKPGRKLSSSSTVSTSTRRSCNSPASIPRLFWPDARSTG